MDTYDNYKITGETSVRKFPDKYDKLIRDLLEEIERLNGIIVKQGNKIEALKSEFTNKINELKSYCDNTIDQKFDQINDKIENNN
jgi:archaellum component FlaC